MFSCSGRQIPQSPVMASVVFELMKHLARLKQVLISAYLLGLLLNARAGEQTPLRAGMIGLDTSHVPEFAKIFNNPKGDKDLAAIRVVAGFPGGTDLPASRDRVGK